MSQGPTIPHPSRSTSLGDLASGSPAASAAWTDVCTFLVLDESAGGPGLLKSQLAVEGTAILTARSAPEAVALATGNPLDLVVLRPFSGGLDMPAVVRVIRSSAVNQMVPILFLIGDGERGPPLEQLGDGFVDVLPWPSAPTLLRSKASLYATLARQRRRLEALQSEGTKAEGSRGSAQENGLLEAILHACPAGIILANPEGRLLRMNPGNATIWGTAPYSSEVSGYAAWKGWWADDSERAGRRIEPHEWALARALRGEHVRGDIVALEPFGQPGTRRYTINSAAPVRNARGEIVGGVVVQMDVTRLKEMELDLKQAERVARQQLAEIAAIYQSAPLGLCVLDLDLRFVRVNERIAEMNGLPISEHLGQTLGAIVPSLETQALAALERLKRERRPVRIEFQGETPAAPGTERIWEASWYPVFEENGALSRIGVVADEVTARKRTQRALQESEELFRGLAENIPQLAWMTDASGDIFWYNQRWFDYTGTTLSDVSGWNWVKCHHPDHVERVIAKFRSSVESGTPWEDTFPLRGADGQYRWFLSRAFPLRTPEGYIARWFGTNTDITDLKRAQEALSEARATIQSYASGLEKTVEERTEKLRELVQELETFSYSIAHDMRAPLRTMVGYCDVLTTDFAPNMDKQALHYLIRIKAAAQRLDLLIKDILDYSRMVRCDLALEPVDVSSLVRDIIDAYPNLRPIRDSIAIRGMPALLGNRAALTQVFSNLLSNAVKFVPPDRSPSIQIWSETLPPTQPDGATLVRVWVQDNGIGIDPAHQAKLFQMFQRLSSDPRYEGTGMGLAIARKAVERMGGQIGVESVPRQGSRFWLVLPEAITGNPS